MKDMLQVRGRFFAPISIIHLDPRSAFLQPSYFIASILYRAEKCVESRLFALQKGLKVFRLCRKVSNHGLKDPRCTGICPPNFYEKFDQSALIKTSYLWPTWGIMVSASKRSGAVRHWCLDEVLKCYTYNHGRNT